MGEHDGLFKYVFRVAAHAAGVVAGVLPPPVAAKLTLRFGPPDAALRARLGAASAQTLERAVERILTATHPTDVLADPPD